VMVEATVSVTFVSVPGPASMRYGPGGNPTMLYEPSAAARVWRVSPVAVFRAVTWAFGGALPCNAASTACVQPARGEQASTTRMAAMSHPNPFFAQTNIVPLVRRPFPANRARHCSQETYPSHPHRYSSADFCNAWLVNGSGISPGLRGTPPLQISSMMWAPRAR
jgi:hypothetical protein